MNQQDLINSILENKDFLDLNNEEAGDLSKYNTDDILKETEKLINEAVKSKTISEYNPKQDSKEIVQDSKTNKNEPSLKINTSIENDTIEEDEIPSEFLSNPIDFVNYLEYELPKKKQQKKKNTFILKKFENEKETKLIVSELNPQEDLSILMLRGDIDITAAIAHDDNIITGDIFGDIKFYSLKDKKLARTLPCPIKKKTQINAIDLSDDGDYAFAGFANGNIAVYELTTNKCKLVNNSAHKTSVINVKFIERIDKKTFKIFSSDEEGNVLSIIIKSGLFGFSTGKVDTLFEKKKLPTFLVHLLKFKENEIKNNNFLKKINKSVIFGNLQNIKLYSIEPKLAEIFSFEKPEHIKDFSIPDIALGLGKQPTSNESYDEDSIELQLLLLISWDKVIYLFTIPILNKNLTFPILQGHYVNDNQIIRIGFLNISTVYLIDKKGNYKILNTRKFVIGDVEKEKNFKTPIASDNNERAEMQNVLQFDGNLLKQLILRTPAGSVKETYLYSIMNNLTKNELNVLTNKKIYNQQLLDYQKYLKDLQKKENWMELLILGMNIYQGKMTSLSGIPLKISERKKVIGEYLQDLISQFLFTNAGSQQVLNNNKNNYFDPSLENARIEKNMEITIEFCIEIESVDYLLDKILKIYESKKYKDIFLSKLEPFILCNKMIKFEIPEEIILDLIKLYESKKKFEALSQILLHINIKSLDVPSIKQKIENLFLTGPLIYLCVNGKSPNYFEPILHIYKKYLSSTEIPEFVSYEKLLTQKSLSLKEIQSTKQYLGHKLFWYIKKSLTGKKFPNYNESMDKKLYHQTICKIVYWLLSDEVLNNLIYVETKTFFDIFIYIFSNEELIEVLEENNDYDDTKKEALEILKKTENSSYSFANINPSDLANHLIIEGNKLGNQAPIIFLYLCIFIVTVAKKMNLAKNNKIAAVKFIIENKDKFGNINLDLNKIKKNLINTLDDLEFNDNDYNEILSVMTTHTFDDVRLFIYKKKKYYKECLELYLNKDSQLEDKRVTLFPFINLTLTNLKLKTGKALEIFKDFKNAVMNNLIRIGELSIDELHSLINTWYSKERKEVLNKLSENPEIQLKYVEILVKKILFSLKENEGIVIDEEPEWVEAILKLHLKLLCYLNKKDSILPSLKQCPLYPINESIELCIQCQVWDGLIYLYQKAGYVDKALEVCLKLIQDNYVQILENLKSNEFNENLHDLKVIDFSKAYNNAINVLEENEQVLSEDHNMWFTLLDKLYQFDGNFLNQKSLIPEPQKKFGEEIEKLISEKLKHLLEKMSTYVGVKKILDIVCEKNKQAEYREFKPLLLKMLASFGSQTHLLNCVREYLTHTCLEEQDTLQQLNIKGRDFDFDNCDVCQKSFNQTLKDKEKLVIFKCNHIEHQYCSFNGIQNYEGNKICPICLKKEIEDAITKSSDDPICSISYEELVKNNNKKHNEDNNTENKINIFNYKKGFIRMRGIDNYDKDKKNMFYYDSANSCRDKYRKVVFDD